MENPVSVLHIDAEYGWRGGQQQAVYLFETMVERGYPTALVCQPDSSLARYAEKHQLPYYAVRMRSELDFWAGMKLSRIVKSHPYSIVHCHAAHAHAIGLWVKLFYRECRLLVTRRVDFSIRRSVMSHKKYVNALIDRIVCVSDQIRCVMENDGVPETSLMTIHSGVDVNKFSSVVLPPNFKEQLGIPVHHMVIGTVAALVDHKDYPNLMHAAKIVLEKHPNVTFCAVGDGELKEMLYSLKKDLNLDERFKFMGYRSDVGNFFRIFDLFVLASHLEGLGTSILDAMASSVPVVATDAGGISEMVIDGVNGRLVPRKNPEALAEAILKLIEDSDIREKYSQQGRQRAIEFSIDNTVEKYLTLYQELSG